VWDDRALEDLATDLLQARDAAALTTPPSRREANFDLERGYQVGRALHERLTRRGYRAVGRKIGFTNPATWREFDLDTPVWAPVYQQTVHLADQGHFRLPLGGMASPRVEPEVVLKLRCPAPAGGASAEEWAGCLEWAAVGFEVVDSHYPDWRFSAAEAVADFGVHAALVVGTPWRVDSEAPHHVATTLQTLKVTLRGGKDFAAEGEGRNALGSPLLALGFLTRVLAGQGWAPPLAPGEVITTGTLTALPYLRRGESYRVEVVGAPLAPLQLELVE
jgi:2-oxo-3-hexenedioate decarboxylase